jgi:hypothetical protein
MDGASFMVPVEKEQLFYDICKEFYDKIIDIPQEIVEYKTCYISDVNNYTIIKPDGKLKLKGRYEYESLHESKNNSNRIARKAAVKYLTEGISLKHTIDSETNIYYFCIAHKAIKSNKKGDSEFQLHDIDNLYYKPKPLQKNIRYIITNKGPVIKKHYIESSKKDDSVFLEAYPDKKVTEQWRQTLMLDIQSTNPKDYDINWIYYYREANKLIQFRELEKFAITNQLKLF